MILHTENIGELKRRLIYDPVAGTFFSKRARRFVGAIVSKRTGYLCIWIKRRRFLCHRLAWAMHYGVWVMPPDEIDHINGVRSDNRIENLRDADRQTQARNVCVGRNNVTGITGVHFCKQTQSYGASIVVDRKQIWLGRHPTIEDAAKARKKAERQYGWPSR